MGNIKRTIVILGVCMFLVLGLSVVKTNLQVNNTQKLAETMPPTGSPSSVIVADETMPPTSAIIVYNG